MTRMRSAFPPHTRRAVFLLLFLVLSAISFAQEAEKASNHNYVVHKFQLWGANDTNLQKVTMYLGFTNGFFAGPRSEKFIDLANCLDAKVAPDQAIAMIDKYYKENPQRWDQPLAIGIVEALTVKDGPCASQNPYQ